MGEEWQPIPSEPGFEASTLGRIRSVDRVIQLRNGGTQRHRGYLRKLFLRSQDGRIQVMVNRHVRKVHHLVLEAFAGPRPLGMVACHKNDIPSDNRPDNLYWGTASDNQRDSVRNGTHVYAKRIHCPRSHVLEQPNLVPSKWERAGERTCLACNRARGYIRRHPELDLQELSDRYYAEIMKEVA